MNPIWLQVSALVLLSSFLFARQWQRTQAVRRDEADRRVGRGNAFEATPLLSQMKAARGKHLKLAQQRRPVSDAHREFATGAGQSLRRLSFFTSRTAPHTAAMTDEHPA